MAERQVVLILHFLVAGFRGYIPWNSTTGKYGCLKIRIAISLSYGEIY